MASSAEAKEAEEAAAAVAAGRGRRRGDEVTAAGPKLMKNMASSINFNQFLEKEKLKSNGSNFTDWFRHVRIFLNGGNLQYVLDAPLGDPPAETETDEVKNVYATRKTRYSQVQCAILCSLEADLQKRFEHHDPHELINELKTIFETHAAVECYEASKHFFNCMMEEGSSVSEHMLAMTGHAKKLSDLGINMNKELPELFSMLKSAEIEIKKEHQVLMVNKTTSFKKQGKSKGKFKKGGKKAATPPVKPKTALSLMLSAISKEKGHWKRNCSKYLADLKSGLVKKKKEDISDIHVIDVYLTGSRTSTWKFFVFYATLSYMNIMYLETLERMNLTKEQLKHSTTEFHGVVPGKKENSLGSIRLPVAFSDANNFRQEMITFEVVPFKSSYHVIFGRPTYHKFHARACYIYNKLKIPGPKGATYQRTMQRCLKDQIGRNVHAYIDDIAVMTRKGSDLISDLTETFENLRRYKMMLNPLKCVFGVPTGKLLGFIVSHRGIEISSQIGQRLQMQIWSRNQKHGSCTSTDPSSIRSRSHPEVPTEKKARRSLQIHFEATNNMAEYKALLHGLRIAKEIGIKHIICCGDSDLVAQQVAGTWNARNSVMAAYRDEVDEIAKCFLGYEVKYVRRDDNTAADMLSKLGSGRKLIPPGIFLEHLRIPSVKGANPENPEVAVSPAEEVMVIIPAWTQPFLDYLIDQKLPEDEVLARQIIRRARSYTIVDGQLYKRSATGVFLKCVSNQDGIEILREIHVGDCGHHTAPRSLVAKAFRLGFYWLTAKEDADKLVKTCRGCQYYATQPNAPAQELKTIPITWPFAVWA
ncbi:hypothetical protein QYE76_035084 [Lolium multiflorum]|uniref:Uncharacterized protein n=1 Tax=Lolium multiflorum TaxID=4521 RepID=A0AAD8R077_LOLMU|nr:hypothetical protein QYE76_035084 [Lolium multiflorum]